MHHKFLFILLFFSASVSAQVINKDSADLMQASTRFLKAFNDFDWPTFKNSFADDATMFHPFWKEPRRIGGRTAVDSAWLQLFPLFTSNPDARQMKLTPSDLHLQLYGNTGIVTFVMGDAVKNLSRRSFVWLKTKGEWKIVHLHASNLAADK
jgi:ketosteroid isomerase-like protein